MNNVIRRLALVVCIAFPLLGCNNKGVESNQALLKMRAEEFDNFKLDFESLIGKKTQVGGDGILLGESLILYKSREEILNSMYVDISRVPREQQKKLLQNCTTQLCRVLVTGIAGEVMLNPGIFASDIHFGIGEPDRTPAAQSQSSQSSPEQSSANFVDGYKSFKFGMKPSELAELAECAPNDYDEKIAAEIVFLEKNDPWEARNAGRSDLLAERAKRIEDLKNIDNRETNYLKALHCKLNLGGTDYSISMNKGQTPSDTSDIFDTSLGRAFGFAFYFNGQEQLGGVQVPLGNFNQEKLNWLIQEVQVKYPLSSKPSDVDIATANSGEGSTVSWFFANNGVELRLVSAGATKLMVLYYRDAISAKEAFKASQKRKVSSGDL